MSFSTDGEDTMNVAISVRDIAKTFKLYPSPKERLIETFHPFRKQYHEKFYALKGISFDIYRGEIVGILGRNGSGKSTLLQIICSVMQATQGEVSVNGRISALLELGAGFNPEFTGRENVILNGALMGIPRKEMLNRIQKIEDFADIGEFFDQPVKIYSSGMYVRVAFAAAIHVDPEILVIDEVLAVGDAKFQHSCYQKIHDFVDQGKTILVVSHSTEALIRICDRGIVIDSGELKHIGSITDAVTNYDNLLFGHPARETVEVIKTEIPNPDVTKTGILNDDTRDVIYEKTCYNPHETRLGTGEVKIIDFEINVDGEIDPVEIRPHIEIILIVKYFFEKQLDNVMFGFSILSLDGTYISGINSEMMDIPGFGAEAGQCISLKLKWKSHFVGGKYFLSLGCHQNFDGEKKFLDVRRSVAMLKFSDTQSYGFVDTEMEVDVI